MHLVRQGCILSPVLFLVVIGDIIHASIAKHHSVSNYWDFAVDICLLWHSILDASKMLYSLENKAASFGLKMNSGKTKSMSILHSSTIRQFRSNAIVLNGHPVEEVNQFRYLGSGICKNSGSDADVDWRVSKAKILSPIWRNSSFPNSLKVRIFKAISFTNKLQVFVNRCHRRIFHIYWPNTISNEKLLKMAQMQENSCDH